jgi:hypothetical protein
MECPIGLRVAKRRPVRQRICPSPGMAFNGEASTPTAQNRKSGRLDCYNCYADETRRRADQWYTFGRRLTHRLKAPVIWGLFRMVTHPEGVHACLT